MQSDLGFHALLMSMTGNSRIQKILHDTRLLIRVFSIRRNGPDAPQMQGISQFHLHILDAVAAQEPEKAMAAMAGHIHSDQPARATERIRCLATRGVLARAPSRNIRLTVPAIQS
jgi:DNA-binding FadR family transcriptional regulator